MSSAAVKRVCFICNSVSSQYTRLNETTVSEHSKTPLNDFVCQFSDNKPSIRNETRSNSRLLCEKCIDKINEYDFACLKSARLEEELRHDLLRTEATYANARDASGLSDDDEVLEISIDARLINENESRDSMQQTIELSEDEEVQTIEISDDEYSK